MGHGPAAIVAALALRHVFFCVQDLLGYRLDDAVDRARVRHGFLSVSHSRSRLSQMGGSQNGAATPETFV